MEDNKLVECLASETKLPAHYTSNKINAEDAGRGYGSKPHYTIHRKILRELL